MLIPKVSNPTRMDQFRPISLCVVLYKLIFKSACHWFQDVMHFCVDEAQNTFVPSFLIMATLFWLMRLLILFEERGLVEGGTLL